MDASRCNTGRRLHHGTIGPPSQVHADPSSSRTTCRSQGLSVSSSTVSSSPPISLAAPCRARPVGTRPLPTWRGVGRLLDKRCPAGSPRQAHCPRPCHGPDGTWSDDSAIQPARSKRHALPEAQGVLCKPRGVIQGSTAHARVQKPPGDRGRAPYIPSTRAILSNSGSRIFGTPTTSARGVRLIRPSVQPTSLPACPSSNASTAATPNRVPSKRS